MEDAFFFLKLFCLLETTEISFDGLFHFARLVILLSDISSRIVIYVPRQSKNVGKLNETDQFIFQYSARSDENREREYPVSIGVFFFFLDSFVLYPLFSFVMTCNKKIIDADRSIRDISVMINIQINIYI